MISCLHGKDQTPVPTLRILQAIFSAMRIKSYQHNT